MKTVVFTALREDLPMGLSAVGPCFTEFRNTMLWWFGTSPYCQNFKSFSSSLERVEIEVGQSFRIRIHSPDTAVSGL